VAYMKESLLRQQEATNENTHADCTTEVAATATVMPPDYVESYGAAHGCAAMAAQNIRDAIQQAANGNITLSIRWMLSALETLSIVTQRSELPQVEVPQDGF
jgi:hypothetical protein